MSSLSICIAGKNKIAVDALLFLIGKGWRSRLMVCPNKTDNGFSSWQPSLIRFAKEFGIPIVSLKHAQEIKDLIFISLEFDRIIRPEEFKTRRLYNIHFSALPAYKGMYTSALPILHGCVSSGVTLHEIDHGIDTGKIISKRTFELPVWWTARDLYFAYLKHGFDLFCQEIDLLLSDQIPLSQDQSADGSTYFSKSSIDYGNIEIKLRDTANGVVRQLRAFSFREYQIPKVEGMEVGAWEILSERSIDKPGTVLETSQDSIVIATIDYNLKLDRSRDWDWFTPRLEGRTQCPDRRHINVTDEMGWSPLIRAAYTNDTDLCRILLENGADPNQPNMNGTTPLMYAFSGSEYSKSLETAKVLIEFGADFEKVDLFGRAIDSYHPAARARIILS